MGLKFQVQIFFLLDENIDNEFEEGFGRLSGTYGLTIFEFVGCDDALLRGEGKINTNSFNWREA